MNTLCSMSYALSPRSLPFLWRQYLFLWRSQQLTITKAADDDRTGLMTEFLLRANLALHGRETTETALTSLFKQELLEECKPSEWDLRAARGIFLSKAAWLDAVALAGREFNHGQ